MSHGHTWKNRDPGSDPAAFLNFHWSGNYGLEAPLRRRTYFMSSCDNPNERAEPDISAD